MTSARSTSGFTHARHWQNPGEVLGPDNTGKYLNLGVFSPMGVEAKPYPQGSADLPDAVARMTKLQEAADPGRQQAAVFFATAAGDMGIIMLVVVVLTE